MRTTNNTGLYDPSFEHDSCGVGFTADIQGRKSHKIITDGLTILKNLAHRGAIGGDQRTGDGAGILTQIPHGFFVSECEFPLPSAGQYGIGMCFMPQKKVERKKIQKLITSLIVLQKGTFLGFRDVPVNPDCLGEIALASMPHICQFFVEFPSFEMEALERKLYVLRRVIEKKILKEGYDADSFYLSSLSANTIIYKGMFLAYQLEAFYPDLNAKKFSSALAMVHQRYSTNTLPSWSLAQPFRYIAHNGEINTIKGNVNKMRVREASMESPLFGREIKKIVPIVDASLSDSGNADRVFEMLVQSGRSPEHSIMMMIPEPFGSKYHISLDKRSFFEFQAAIMEPWDGPASLSFTDGNKIGAVLDRNGLRPARYLITKNDRIVFASETGVLDVPPEDVLRKGRLGPGKILMVDISKKRVQYNNELKSTVSRQKPYRRWLNNNRIELRGLFQPPGSLDIMRRPLRLSQKAFGYTMEELNHTLVSMVTNAQEPISSMGNDASLAALSDKPQLLYNYFKQLFAQVTNPPIDPYRENLVMSLMSFIGREKNLMTESPGHCHQLKLLHPILSNEDMAQLQSLDNEQFKSATVPVFFNPDDGPRALETALARLSKQVEEQIDNGCSLVVLSDKKIGDKRVPIPALLALTAVHHHLVKTKKRQLAGLILETGEAREVMHFAMLVGFGASAVNPYLAFESIAGLKKSGKIPKEMKLEEAIDNYINAVKKGLLKIMSKMGVSTVRSYRGAQLFEAVGLDSKLIDKYFPGTPSRIGGIGLDKIAQDAMNRHQSAFFKGPQSDIGMESGGNIHYRAGSEKHLLTPEVITTVQRAVWKNDYTLFKKYSTLVNDGNTNLCTLRGLFSFKKQKSIPLEEVESEDSIIKRFVTPAMSIGSISPETHETMAIAMNRLGASSNSGEGGEDEKRYMPLANGDSAKSNIKQVASARFGVNSNYLVNAKELQIKIAQGAKPGEGGQLPGHKVSEFIAKVRYSTPGVMLISPPPHHDIYSIEDLAQLIFDLKNANPQARISVKLVAEAGVGTVAAGVAKGKADMVLISGHDGGTGASPISSIKYAGIPWEIGLAETQQTLIMNKLRDRIRIQTDGKLMTGRDVIIGALLGAEEFGFGTISLVSLGCIMMRKCHLNTCPVGVATQDPALRKKFTGKPEYIINFMTFIAREVRELMAELGFRRFEDMVGHTEFLEVNQALDYYKSRGLDFSKILNPPPVPAGSAIHCIGSQEHEITDVMDVKLIKKAKAALDKKKKVSIREDIRNSNRTVGAMLSSEVSLRYGSVGLPEGTINCKFTGSAGQSFGAFLAPGIRFELEGDANDYLGKGLSGGQIVVYHHSRSSFRPERNIVTGNVSLFGATAGRVFINGRAGERFAVRNSGAVAVVEGVGDHGCEYMTGGIVVVLGTTGINFGAGMSGGIAYVLDEDQLFDTKCNLEMIDIEPLVTEADWNQLYSLIKEHVDSTGSLYAERILERWEFIRTQFVKVIPLEYKKALERIKVNEFKETDLVSITEEVAG
ncbi:MAG: glutamate synthase large subunit [Fibrobacteria bacterium]|nr:glutamate synthase large subunit [Fibrobacteria bacterium]